MPIKHFLIEAIYCKAEPDLVDISDSLNGDFDESIKFNITDISEDDITSEPVSIDQGGSVELGRRRINLRKFKEHSIPIGSACKIKVIASPTMLVEYIKYEKSPQNTGDTQEYEIAQCVWFANDVMNRAIFKASDLEAIVDITQMSTMSRAIKQHPAVLQEIIDGQKISAIKKVREITGCGLKEAKDLVESVTSLDIERWKQGIYR